MYIHVFMTYKKKYTNYFIMKDDIYKPNFREKNTLFSFNNHK